LLSSSYVSYNNGLIRIKKNIKAKKAAREEVRGLLIVNTALGGGDAVFNKQALEGGGLSLSDDVYKGTLSFLQVIKTHGCYAFMLYMVHAK